MYDRHELKQNIGWANSFKPLNEDEWKSLIKQGRTLAKEWGKVYGPVV